MEALLALVGGQSPILIMVAVMLGVLLPKLVDIIFKSKQHKVTREQASIARLTKLTDDLYERVDKLEKELAEWKDKYYEMVELSQEIKLKMRWEDGTEESQSNKHEKLEDLLDNCAVGVHLVGEDGRILWANKAEMELLGYEEEYYLGKPISTFHADANVIEAILNSLKNLSELKSCPARLITSAGEFVYVMINSNVYEEEGRFIHTRCFTTQITPQIYNSLRQ